MGSDMYMESRYSRDSRPVWQRVRGMEEDRERLQGRVGELTARVSHLEREKEALERTVARLSVQVNGGPFPGEGDAVD